MSTLTQILLASVMNYLGITGEMMDNKVSVQVKTVTEINITCLNHSRSCNFSYETNCLDLHKNSVVIVSKIGKFK